jgi:hypothetical protein
LYRIRQDLDGMEIADLPAAVNGALAEEALSGAIGPGMRVALTAGSRGIDRIGEVLRLITDRLRRLGANPFVVPAMGSHGGEPPDGPVHLLASLGITEETVGAPIEADPETVVLGEFEGLPVYCLRSAAEADGMVLINRIKPHTSFSGDHESGLAKMLAVGLGGRQGATVVHAQGVKALPTIIPGMAKVVLDRTKVLTGIALIENGLDRLKKISAVPAGEILSREPGLLEEARRLRPMLPFDEADVLVVDSIGKDLSGTGMDTHVIGRRFITGEPEPDFPRIKRVVALRLSPGSKGNAYGIGLADVTTQAVIRAVDHASMNANAMASTFVERVRIPVALPSDRQAIEAAVSTCNHPRLATLKLARIHDTLHLEELHVSKRLLDTLSLSVDLLEGPIPWPFDDEGNLRLP